MSARDLFMVSAVTYFLSNIADGAGVLVLGSALSLIGLLCLLFGVLALIREKRSEKTAGK